MPIMWVPLVWPGGTGSGMTVKLKTEVTMGIMRIIYRIYGGSLDWLVMLKHQALIPKFTKGDAGKNSQFSRNLRINTRIEK